MKDEELPMIYRKDGSHDIASLRDYFAAKAMQGLLSDPNAAMLEDDMNHWAALSYKMADAMLRAREK